MKPTTDLEQQMISLAKDYSFDYFELDNNDERIAKYYQKRMRIQNALMKMNSEERNIIAFTFLYPDKMNWITSKYAKKEYEVKKKIALVTFFHCLKL